MGEAREGDCRVQLIIVLFFICVVSGGVLLSHFVFLKETEASDWYCIAGITLEAIPWAFWFLVYLYTCFKLWVIKRQQPPLPEAAEAATALQTCSSPKSDEQLNAHFGLAEDEGQGMEGGGNEDQIFGDDGLNRASSLSALDDVELGIREISGISLKIESSSCG